MKEQIISTEEKWIVAAIPHTRSNKNMIDHGSISPTRREAINRFMCQSDYKKKDWERWKRDFNFKAIKATVTIEIYP